MSELEARIERGDVIVLDGATGTELERRGVPMDDAAWCAAALVTHPQTVREVHEDYIRAGADVIITNTFPTARHVLEPAGMGERFQELNTLAVELARQARESVAESPVYIAGSISTFSARHDHSYEPPEKMARTNYREQAEVLAGARVDLIVLEMMRDIDQTRYALEAAASTSLPVWVGFSCKRAADGTVVLWDGGHTLAEAISEIPRLGASLVNVMHTLVEDAGPALREVAAGWEGPVGAYPHAGKFVMPNWQFTDMISPEDFARRAMEWLDLGARVIGGCCGIGPDHIRALKQGLPASAVAEG